MTAPSSGYVSLLGPQSGWMLPAPDVAGLSDDEQRLVTGLSSKLAAQAPDIVQRWQYYDGLQQLRNIGISIPPQLAGVRTVVDWPRICVDPIVDRCVRAGFRLPKQTEVDSELEDLAQLTGLDGELPFAFLDSMVARCGYVVVGAPDIEGDAPLVTVESPLNMTVTWDPRTRRIVNGYQAFETNGTFIAALYLPDQNVFMSRQDGGAGWAVYHRDQHRFGDVSIARMPNRARSSDRDGRSQITPAVMNTTDSAYRALLGMEIAREVYSIPHLYILGATESDWQGPDGQPKSALQMAMTKILAFERDEEGNLPQVGQLTAFDPSVFTKIINEHAQLMASYTGFPPSYFGQTTTANPASADAIRVAESGIERSASAAHRQFTPEVRRVAQLMWRFANRGAALPDEMRRLEIDWADPKTPQPASMSDAISKQIAVGAIPPTSDVTLAELGYTPLQRARLEQDRKANEAQALEAQLTSSIAGRSARAGNAIANDLEAAAGDPTGTGGTQAGR